MSLKKSDKPNIATPAVANIPIRKASASNSFGLLLPTNPSSSSAFSSDSLRSNRNKCKLGQLSGEQIQSNGCSVAGSKFHSSQHNGHQLHNNVENGASNMESNSPSSSTASNADVGNGGDAEGVWSMDIDQAFHEALQIYPPCGRRKIILSDEGKMYGRNELIARYIKIRCGKTRTRKQVSSHIQVLARKKARETNSKIKTQDSKYPDDECGENNNSTNPIPHHNQLRNPKLSSSLSPSSSCLNISVGGPSAVNASAISNSRSSGGSSSGALSLEAAAANEMQMSLIAAVRGGNNMSNTNNSNNNNDSRLNNANANNNNSMASAALAAVAAGIGGPASAMWPYNAVNAATASSVLNNYYTASMMSDEKFYQQFAALAGASLPTTSQLNANIEHLSLDLKPVIDSTGVAGDGNLNPADYTISSKKLTLCGFTAYIEQVKAQSTEGEKENKVDLVKIPKISEEPLENIKLSDIQCKYPAILKELFKAGPSDAFFLVKCWANVSFNIADERTALYAVDSFYDSPVHCDISVSTKVCSFGNQVVEKVEIYSPVDVEAGSGGQTTSTDGNAPFHFRLEKSPMCDYMVRFIAELKKLKEPELMDSVLDNFTVLQVVTDKATSETLIVIAFVFEVSPEPEPTCRIYRLVS